MNAATKTYTTHTIKQTAPGFSGRLRSMWQVDSRRMLRTPLFYLMLGISFLLPVLILVMTTMAGGTALPVSEAAFTAVSTAGSTMLPSVPAAGEAAAALTPFTNTWQIIAAESGSGAMAMDMSGMCNINLLYFLTAVFLCLFVSEDFSSGYVKNLFTSRSRKGDYVASKTLAGFLAGASFLISFFFGTILGGSFAGLSFDLGTAGVSGLILCMLSKIFLMGLFSSLFVAMSVFGKKRLWISLLLSLFAGMLLFMMVPMMTPLDSHISNMFLCLAGGAIFAAAIGLFSKQILLRTSLV